MLWIWPTCRRFSKKASPYPPSWSASCCGASLLLFEPLAQFVQRHALPGGIVLEEALRFAERELIFVELLGHAIGHLVGPGLELLEDLDILRVNADEGAP